MLLESENDSKGNGHRNSNGNEECQGDSQGERHMYFQCGDTQTVVSKKRLLDEKILFGSLDASCAPLAHDEEITYPRFRWPRWPLGSSGPVSTRKRRPWDRYQSPLLQRAELVAGSSTEQLSAGLLN